MAQKSPAVQEQLLRLTDGLASMTDESRSEATRSLKRWGLDAADEKLIMLHVACQSSCHSRVSRKMFEANNVREEIEAKTETSHTVYLVPKENLSPEAKAEFPERATIEELMKAKCVYDAVADLPANLKGRLIVDRSIPLTRLGPHVMDHKIAVSHLKTVTLSEGVDQASLAGPAAQKALMDKPADGLVPAACDTPAGSLQQGAGATGAASSKAAAIGKAAEENLLDGGCSDMAQGKDAFEQIASGLKDCFKEGRFEAAEANDGDNVENKVKDFVRFAKQEAKANPDQPVPEYMYQFVGFTVKQLLKYDCYDVLPKVVPSLLELQSAHKDYADESKQEVRLLKGLGRIANFTRGSAGEVGLDFLHPGEKTLIDNSTLFHQFLREHIKVLCSNLVSAHSLTNAVRVNKATTLLKSRHLADGTRASLEFGRTVLAASEGDNMAFLVRDADRFAQLESWLGKSADLLALSCLAANNFKDLEFDAFLKAASMIMPHSQAIDAIKHPVMKAVLAAMAKVKELTTKADTDCRATLCTVLYKEIAVAKLGISAVLDSSVPSGFASLPAEVVKALGRLLVPLVKQPKPDECPTLHAIASAMVASGAPQTPDGASSHQKPDAAVSAQPEPEAAASMSTAPPLDFSVGSKLYVLAEGKYQHCQVEVVKATTIQVKVKVCDGQHKGASATLQKKMLGAELPMAVIEPLPKSRALRVILRPLQPNALRRRGCCWRMTTMCHEAVEPRAVIMRASMQLVLGSTNLHYR
eukprot:TRINITY_DN18501_c0_g1_i1.p1 TRINITY_DN18501_c0_g1~~TRINITY_DN18501_c0_g1_i1.p1  ORF type:complete len:755 (-),score=167.11 TRINITY_DN18501_c0_g1_i1:117-2381(-)